MYNNVFIEILKCINIYLYLINKFNKMMVKIVIKCIRIYCRFINYYVIFYIIKDRKRKKDFEKICMLRDCGC